MLKLLIVNLARYGDIIQSTPMIQGLKKRYPGSHISLLVNNNFSQVCSLIPYVDNFIELDFKKITGCLSGEAHSVAEAYGYFKNFFKKLRSIKFDITINITPHDIGVITSFLAGDRLSYREKLSAWSLYYLNITQHWKTLPFNLVDIYLKIAGLELQKNLPCIQISRKALGFADNFLKQQGLKDNELLIGFNPGASRPEKQWPPEYFIKTGRLILKAIDSRIILFGSDHEYDLCEYLKTKLGEKVINSAGKTDLMQLAALMSRTKILITNDTGPMHIAASCGTKIISLHMGKEKCISTGPYGEGHIALQPNLVCHPCKNPEACPSRYCRNLISPNIVFKMTEHLLKGSKLLNIENITAEMDKADVFVSAFDNESFLDFYPVCKSEITIQALCMRFLRYVWDFSLSGSCSDNDTEINIKRCVEQLLCMINKYYYINDHSALRMRWGKVGAVLDNLKSLANEGHKLSANLDCAAQNQLDNLEKLKNLSKGIDAVDDKIISIGEAYCVTAPLTQMLSFQKDNLNGYRLNDLARQTGLIYMDFKMRCKILHMIGNKFFECLMSYNTGHLYTAVDNKSVINHTENKMIA